jgi:outer membrane protein assembly factor BamA
LWEAGAAGQRCQVQDARGHTVLLERMAEPWSGWPALCNTLVRYMALPSGSVDAQTMQHISENMAPLGYFEQVSCRPTDAVGVHCRLTPAIMVHSYSLHGHVPLTLLQEDLRRRVFMRPGTIVHDVAAETRKQQERLQAYLVAEGYFAAQVSIQTHTTDGVEPNAGLHLAITTMPGSASTVGEVAVHGDQAVPDGVLAQVFRHRWVTGMPMRFRPAQFADDVAEATRRLQAAGWPAAHITGTFTHDAVRHKVHIRLQVNAGQQVTVRFCGNTAFSDKALRRLANFEAAGAIDAAAVEALRQQVVRRYQGKGFAEVQVQPSSARIDATRQEITFAITAGRRLPVGAVRLIGLADVDARALREHAELITRPSGAWRHRYWVDGYVAHDARTLQRALRAMGYAEAQVRAERQIWPDGAGLDVVFAIDPGPRRLVHTLQLDAAGAPFDANSMRPRLSLAPQRPFVADAVEGDAHTLQAALAAQGYTTAEVDGEADLPPPGTPGDVDVRLHVRPGPRARVGGVFMRGNLRTAEGVLYQELHSRPGDPLDLAAIGAARRRLRAYSIFNTVQLSPLTPQPDDPTTWLLLGLEEREVRTLDGVASFSSDYRFGVGVDYRDRNVFGRTMQLSTQLRVSNASELLPARVRIGNQDLLNVTLRAPRPFGLPLDAEAQLLYRYQDVVEFRERRMGGGGSISRPLLQARACKFCPDIMGRLGYELTEAYRVDNTSDGQTAGGALPDTTIARLIPIVDVSRRDSPIDTTQGYNFNLRLELGHPALAGFLHRGATAFWRLLAGVQGYVPLGTPLALHLDEHRTLGGPFVLAAALQYNAAGPWTRHGAVPPSETFGYGGDFSVRGLANRASTQQFDNAHYMVTGSVELRWYAIPNLGFGTIQLAGFADVGSVSADLRHVLHSVTVTAGPVLRYVTPIGPLSLAYGRALMLPDALRAAPRAAPPHGRVHFTFGYSF